MTKKQALRLTAFLLLTALMLGGLNWLLRDRETTLSSLYSEPDNTVDVFIVGSSHVNSGYIPGVLWEEYGISAHNVFSWSQPMWISYHYIKEGLKTQDPSVVVVDLNGMLYGNSNEQPEATDETNYLNSFSITPGLNFLEMIGTVDDCGIDLRDPIDFLPLPHYHTRWKVLSEAMFTYDPYNDHSYLKGYGFQTLIHPLATPAYPATDARQAPYETAVTYLDKIVTLSEKEGFRLIFVLAPYTYQENELAIFNWLEDYSAQHGIEFLNYCTDDGDRIGYDWAADFCDARHANYTGALKLTRDLGEHLTSGDYPLKNAASWSNVDALNTDADKMYRTIELWEAIIGTPLEFLQWAARSGGTLAIAASGDCSSLPDSVWETFALAGYDQLVSLKQPGASYAAVLDSGHLQQMADLTGETAVCMNADNTIHAESTGRLSCGILLRSGETTYATDQSGIVLLYYDQILERPVYQITIDAVGNFIYTDLGSK